MMSLQIFLWLPAPFSRIPDAAAPHFAASRRKADGRSRACVLQRGRRTVYGSGRSGLSEALASHEFRLLEREMFVIIRRDRIGFACGDPWEFPIFCYDMNRS
jgi:hypothetical protein